MRAALASAGVILTLVVCWYKKKLAVCGNHVMQRALPDTTNLELISVSAAAKNDNIKKR